MDSQDRRVPVATQELAKWVCGIALYDVPGPVILHIKNCIIDTLGCGLFGSRQSCGKIATEVTLNFCSDGPSMLWGNNCRTDAAGAAMTNGTSIHGFEIDDTHDATGFHPGSVIVPAVFSVADMLGSSGREILISIIVGYEFGIRMSQVTGLHLKTKGFHTTGIVGSIASAAAISKLLGLNIDQTIDALTIGATQAAGLYSARRNSMTKRLHAGKAAQNGVLAGFLAQKGFTGSIEAIEADYGGFLSCFSDGAKLSTMIDNIGSHWHLLDTGFKVYPTGASTHTTIDCLDDLMSRGLLAANLNKLTIYMTKPSWLGAAWPYEGGSLEAAQMNGYFVAAFKIVFGEVSIEAFQQIDLMHSEILKIIKRIEIIHDPDIDMLGSSYRYSVRLVGNLVDGKELTAQQSFRKGSVNMPISTEDLKLKFIETSQTVLSDENIQEVLQIISFLENQPNTEKITAALSGC
jgi:2-methylcitrate dehydratase PrpD